MDVDAAQYAEISREMSITGDYLHIYDRGVDYLDKPPMLFWVTSLSIKAFGVNNFGYKLPSILFALLAMYATYRLARLLYDENTGRVAALVLGVCQGAFLMTNDVRTDTILMACVATALWAIKECEIRRRWQYVLLGTAAIAAGLMTKGPIALFVPLFAFGTDWLLHRKWKAIFNPWHLLDIVLIGIFLIPMCIGLYQQFDLHPEKIIEGKTGTSGLRFFFWTQSFGRITGESSWDNGADPSFLLVSMLWAFLPWIFLFLTALVINVRELITQKFRLSERREWVSTGGFILSYCALGLSHYQLPHYIFVAFPLAAVMVAGLFYRFYQERKFLKLARTMEVVQWVACALLMVGALLILLVVFPIGPLAFVIWSGGLVVIALFVRNKRKGRMVWLSAATMIVINIILTHHFYYNLLQYQVGSQVGRWARKSGIPASKLYAWKMNDPVESIHYYANGVVPTTDNIFKAHTGDYVITMPEQLDSIALMGRQWDEVRRGSFFKVSEVTPQFLNYKARPKAVQTYCLIHLR